MTLLGCMVTVPSADQIDSIAMGDGDVEMYGGWKSYERPPSDC